MSSNGLMYFVKYPEPGTVKTRLAAGTSDEEAAEIYADMAVKILGELERVDADMAIFFSPADAEGRMREWLGRRVPLLPQCEGDLGLRMHNAFMHALELGYERVFLTGSDIPGLTTAICNEAFNALVPGKAVIGPASDGGYYGIGFHVRSYYPAVFENMPWSTNTVCSASIDRMANAGLEVHRLPTLDDVDTVEDLEQARNAGLLS